MAQKRRRAKESGLDRITLMLPAELKATLESAAEPGVRTFSDVVRECIRRGLRTEGASADDHPSAWARAAGEATEIVAENIETVCRSSNRQHGSGHCASRKLEAPDRIGS